MISGQEENFSPGVNIYTYNRLHQEFYLLSGFSTHSKLVGGFCLRICGLECDCQELTQRVGSESNVEETTYSSSDCQEEETQRAASEEVGDPALGVLLLPNSHLEELTRIW